VLLVSDENRQSQYDFYRAARSHEAQGRYAEALEAYAKAIEVAQDYADAWFYKGRLHHRLKQREEAVCCAKRALELKPSWQKHVQSILNDA
jgi:tetratricopeptide (TPR) repeat protein